MNMDYLPTNHTFVVCAHGESPFLDACVESVVAQSEKSNVIITTSTPNALIKDIAEKYRVPLFINAVDTDMQGSWNYGVSCAETQFVTVCHQDDFYAPDYFALVSKQFSDDVIMIHTAYADTRDGKVYLGANTRIRRLLCRLLVRPSMQARTIFKKAFLMFGNAVCCPTCTYNSNRTGLPIFTSKLKHACDWDIYANYASMPGRIVYIPQQLFFKRIHDSSATKDDIITGLREKEDYYMLRRFWPSCLVRGVLSLYKVIYKCNL